MTIPLAIVDDHPVVREGLRAVIQPLAEVDIVVEAASGDELLSALSKHSVKVVLLDVKMPGRPAWETIAEVTANFPECKVLLLTSFVEAEVLENVFEAGAIGYLLKDILVDDLVAAIYSANSGRPYLHPEVQQWLLDQRTARKPRDPLAEFTRREKDVLQQIASGRSNKQIAAALHLTEGTVKGYVSNVLQKLGFSRRTEAAVFALEHGLT